MLIGVLVTALLGAVRSVGVTGAATRVETAVAAWVATPVDGVIDIAAAIEVTGGVTVDVVVGVGSEGVVGI